jgi:hypothetical protein
LKKLQLTALLTIAMVLLAQFYLWQLHPRLVLHQKNDQFFEFAKECHQAVSERDKILRLRRSFSKKVHDALMKTSEVSLINCHRKDELRLVLLNNRVSQHQLDLIELRAKNASASSLMHFVGGTEASQ